MLFFFEDFALDTSLRELRRGGELLSMEPKVFDLLAHLITNRERVVSKDDLVAVVWDGRIVSDSAMTTAINAARMALGDSGEAQRLIKTLPRKGLRFVGKVREEPGPAAAQASVSTPVLTLPDKPSIAVLPFVNLGGDPEQEYFADGIAEDIITALSKMRALFVIARNSSFTYKGRAVDAKHVGRELGVRYVLEGSVRRAGSRVRITVLLIDSASGASLSADRFEGTLEDIFDLQDQVTERVIGAIAPKLEQAEIARAKRKPTGNLDAYDLYLRGISSYHQYTKQSCDDALEQLYRAIDFDNDFALAYAMAALVHTRQKANGWVAEPTEDVAEVRRLARQAVRLGKDDASVLALAGFSLAFAGGELDDGAAFIERALFLNPNLAAALNWSGWAKVWLGEPDTAIEHLSRAIRLSPVDPFSAMMQAGIAHAHLFAGRFDEGASWAEKALREQPESLPALRAAAANLALAGRSGEAREIVARLLSIDAAFRVSTLRRRVGPYRKPEHLALYEEALCKAGLPER